MISVASLIKESIMALCSLEVARVRIVAMASLTASMAMPTVLVIPFDEVEPDKLETLDWLLLVTFMEVKSENKLETLDW